ncbi:ankyrin repeat domain-containing protein [Bdellovibrio sp. 22V]|uniref:ankyrin repeat domain-containing protein n=1 Tax=Bdellovibrio TaxID=958 RepID=UPI0025430663|nr:ankyrin repeat domain-containing protein [Bdellovibrio sp. 22V]WII72358.1 ankyrin repeat domain-containing protein [Bdellovibrio sp. 22V]
MSAGDWKELYSAALSGNMELVRYHIENDVNPNYQHPEILATPLVAAITAGHTDIALYLLENKADPRLQSFFDEMTPLEAAIKYKNEVVLAHLQKLGVQIETTWFHKLGTWLKRYCWVFSL